MEKKKKKKKKTFLSQKVKIKGTQQYTYVNAKMLILSQSSEFVHTLVLTIFFVLYHNIAIH